MNEMSAICVKAYVHFDFKGLALSPDELCAQFEAVKNLGAAGVLLEWEDIFPYEGVLDKVRSRFAYAKEDVARVLRAAEKLDLDVIPLVQTFGHLEFILKLPSFACLRENADDPGTLCPAHPASKSLVAAMLTQITALHPGSSRIHIGCDEPVLSASVRLQKAQHVISGHIACTLSTLKSIKPSIKALMWHDAAVGMDDAALSKLLASGVEIVCWDYTPKAKESTAAQFAERCLRHRGIAPHIATAYKGAEASDAIVPDESVRRQNQISWHQWVRSKTLPTRVDSWTVVLTGWSRFSHLQPLVEDFFSGWNSLAQALEIWTGAKSSNCQRGRMGRFASLCKTLSETRRELRRIEKDVRNNTPPSTARHPIALCVRQWLAAAKSKGALLKDVEREILDSNLKHAFQKDWEEFISCKLGETIKQAAETNSALKLLLQEVSK